MVILVFPFGTRITGPRLAFEKSYSRFIGFPSSSTWPLVPDPSSLRANRGSRGATIAIGRSIQRADLPGGPAARRSLSVCLATGRRLQLNVWHLLRNNLIRSHAEDHANEKIATGSYSTMPLGNLLGECLPEAFFQEGRKP